MRLCIVICVMVPFSNNWEHQDKSDPNCWKHIKVRDHDHRTSEYRGAVHSCCNINYFCNRYLPVVVHI